MVWNYYGGAESKFKESVSNTWEMAVWNMWRKKKETLCKFIAHSVLWRGTDEAIIWGKKLLLKKAYAFDLVSLYGANLSGLLTSLDV